MMPTLYDVFAAFPDRQFLINVKSRDASEGEKLATVLNALPAERRRTIMVYGGDEPIDAIRRLSPDVRTISRAAIRTCLIRYIGYGWTGLVPAACRNAMVLVPINAAPWLWGWPDRFLARMNEVNSAVFVLGPYSSGEFSTGIDTPESSRGCRKAIPAASGPTRSRQSPSSRARAKISSAIPGPPARCVRRIPCSHRHIGGCPPASAPARGWIASPKNAGRAKRTAWCLRNPTAP